MTRKLFYSPPVSVTSPYKDIQSTSTGFTLVNVYSSSAATKPRIPHSLPNQGIHRDFIVDMHCTMTNEKQRQPTANKWSGKSDYDNVYVIQQFSNLMVQQQPTAISLSQSLSHWLDTANLLCKELLCSLNILVKIQFHFQQQDCELY